MTEPPPIQRPERLDPGYWRSGPDLPTHLQSPPDPEIVLAPRRPARAVAVEVVVAAVVSGAAAAAMGWQVLTHLGDAVPGSGGDPFTGVWALAWSGHGLRPGAGIGLSTLFDGTAFYPAQYGLALGDSLLGLGPLTWLPAGLVTVYGLLCVFGPALTALGGYTLTRQLGAHPLGAAVAGAAIAWTPWREGRLGQLGVLWVAPMLLGFAMLARGHGFTMSGRRTGGRPLWAVLGWVALALQLTVGFSVGLPMVYLLGVIAVLVVVVTPFHSRARRRRLDREGPVDWDATAAAELARRDADVHANSGFWNEMGWGRTDGSDARPAHRWESDDESATRPILPGDPAVVVRPRPRRFGWLLLTDLVAGAAFTAFGLLMAYPYFRVRAIDPESVRQAGTTARLTAASPHLVDLVTPPEAVRNTWTWLPVAGLRDHLGHDGVGLLPGAVLVVLALIGLVVSSWRWWWRVVLAIAVVVAGALSLGTRFPHWFADHVPGHAAPFVLLFRHAPGWPAELDPGRLVLFAVLALAVLAAGAVSRLAGVRASTPASAVSATARTQELPVDGARRPWFRLAVLAVLPILVVLEGWAWVPLETAPAEPAAFAAATGPLVVLPSTDAGDGRVMFWSAGSGFTQVANGSTAFVPLTLTYARSRLAGFPDARSVAYLRANGYRSVVVLRANGDVPGWPWIDRVPAKALHLTRQDFGYSVLYTLSG